MGINYKNTRPTTRRQRQIDAVAFSLSCVAYMVSGVAPVVETTAGWSRSPCNKVDPNHIRRNVCEIKNHIANMLANGTIVGKYARR